MLRIQAGRGLAKEGVQNTIFHAFDIKLHECDLLETRLDNEILEWADAVFSYLVVTARHSLWRAQRFSTRCQKHCGKDENDLRTA